jgi:hypothetical protein
MVLPASAVVLAVTIFSLHFLAKAAFMPIVLHTAHE